MNTINSTVPGFSHRVQSRAVAQPSHARLEDSDNRALTDQAGAGPKAKGVMRLVQDGHFKGVADVRLRINFHEQLQALDKSAEQDNAQQAVDALDQVVSDSIVASPQLPSPVAEALKAFQSNLAKLSDADGDTALLGGAVDTAFGELMASLRELLQVDGTDPVEQVAGSAPIAGDESTATGTTAVASADQGFDAAALIAALEAGFADFEAALSSIDERREFSAPNGNGVAFEKFMNIYRGLSSAMAEAGAEEPMSPLVDQTA